MQDLASEFSKIFRGDIPGPSQRQGGGATPFRAQHPTRGVQVPRCWDPNLGPPQLFSRGCAHGVLHIGKETYNKIVGFH